jgi:hypothetical protein
MRYHKRGFAQRDSAEPYLIEISFENMADRDSAFDPIETLLHNMGEIGTISASNSQSFNRRVSLLVFGVILLGVAGVFKFILED